MRRFLFVSFALVYMLSVCSAMDITWVYISDPGVPGHEGFDGPMSKYETTNIQYCEYLNDALNDGMITVHNGAVYDSGDTSYSKPYFETHVASSYSQITYSAGAFTVIARDGYSMVNHPVVEVSWYGANAFCDYYGFRLPTEWEWQAVADYDGTYNYGCGISIDHKEANYDNDNPLALSSRPHTTPANQYSSHGYGMYDMAGNVAEWTDSLHASLENRYIHRGGSWFSSSNHCRASFQDWNPIHETSPAIGFRVCRSISEDPVEALLDLSVILIALDLPKGPTNSLVAKLESASQALSDDNERNDIVAVNALGAFINQVEAQTGKKIDPDYADELIAIALYIVDLLTVE